MEKCKDFAEERSKEWAIEGVRQLMSGNIRYSNLYFSFIDQKYFSELLQSLIRSQAPLTEANTQLVLRPVRFRWFCHCFASYYNIENKFDAFLLIQPRFIASELQTAHEIRAYLRNPNITKDTEMKLGLAKVFIDLIEDSRPLSIWLHPHLKIVFESLDTFLIYNRFRFNMFCLYEDCSRFTDEEISKIDFEYTDIKPYQSLVQIPQIYTNTKILNIIERYLFKKYHFPIPTTFANSSLYISLVNTSFSTNNHFIDIFEKHIKELFNNGDFQNFKKFTGYFGSFQPWFFASVFNDKCAMLPYYFEKPEFKYENISTELMNRLYNDRQLFQTVRELKGTTVSCIEFLNHSIPFLFFQSIRVNISIFYEPLEILQKINFYIISDEDKLIDFDFCYYYFVLFKLMENFEIQIKDETVFETDLISQLEIFINLIQSKEKKALLFHDLLSLIFIKNKEDQFICPFIIASSILKVLLELNEDQSFMPYIKSGYQRFNLVYCLNLSQTIDSAIYPNTYQLLDALLKDDTDIAKYLACISSQNEQLFQLSINVKKYSQKEPFNILQSDESTIKEIALSFDDKTALRYSLNFDTNEIEHKLFERRFKEFNHFITNQNYPEISYQLSNFDTNKWKKYDIKENLPLLSSFYNRLESFIPISLHIKFGETVKEVLLLNPRETIISLLKSDQNEKSEEIAKKLNIDIYSIVFSGDFSEEVLFHFSKEFPVIAYASIISNNRYLHDKSRSFYNKSIAKVLYEGKNDKEDKKIQYVRNRLLNSTKSLPKKDATFKSLNEKIEFYDDFNQSGMNDDDLLDCLDQLYENFPKEKDLILDIRYRVDENLFKQRISKHLSNDSLKKIRELFNECLIDTEKYDFLISLPIKPFPLENSFRELINRNEYDKSRQFYDYFSDLVNFNDIVIEIAKDLIHNHKNIEPIMKLFPFVKEEIFSSFPFQQISEFDSSFQKFLCSIPEDWENNLHPNEILSKHIKDYYIIRELLQEFKFLNIDDKIIELIELNIVKNTYYIKYDQVLQLAEALEFFFNDIRDKNKFVDYIINKICSILSSIETTLNNEGIYEITLLRKCIIMLRNNEFVYSSSNKFIIDKIDVLCQISIRQLFSKFNQKTCFKDFEKKEKGEMFVDLSLKFDDVELLQNICKAWNLNFNSYLDRRIVFSYQMSIFDHEYILDYSSLTDEDHIASRDKLTDDVSNILSHALFYDQNFVQSFIGISLPIENLIDFLSYSLTTNCQPMTKKRSKTGISSVGNIFRRNTSASPRITDPKSPSKQYSLGFMNHKREDADTFNLGFYQRIQNIIKTKNIRTKNQRTQLEYFLENIASPPKAISAFIFNCNLNKAVQVLNNIKDVDEKKDLFSNVLFKKSVYYDNIERLRSAMKITPDYAKPYLRSLLELSTKSNLLNLKLSVTQFLNLHDVAAESAIELYNEQSGNYQNLAFLDIAQIEIALELRIRKQGGKKETCILTTEKLNDLMKKIDLQRKYNMFLCEKKLQNSSFSIFGSEFTREPMVFLLFKEKYFELAFEFVFEFQIPMSVIGEKIIDILISESDQSLISYISVLEENCSQNFFREILYSMLNRIIFVFRKFDVADQIIHKSVDDIFFKCALMVQFNMLEDAAEIAFKNNFDDFIPVIANQAYIVMKKELVQKCQKYLENIADQSNSISGTS